MIKKNGTFDKKSGYTQRKHGTSGQPILNEHDPEWTPSQMDMIPNEYHPEWAQSRKDTIPNGHNPK